MAGRTVPDGPGIKVAPPVQPKHKMKKLQWNKIQPHVLHRSNSSVWRKVGQLDGVQPDYSTEEELFMQQEKKKEEKKEAAEKKKEPKEVGECIS